MGISVIASNYVAESGSYELIMAWVIGCITARLIINLLFYYCMAELSVDKIMISKKQLLT